MSSARIALAGGSDRLRLAPIAAGVLRYAAAMTIAFAGLLALLLMFSRRLEGPQAAAPPARDFSAAAIEYDRALLAALSDWVLEADKDALGERRTVTAAQIWAHEEKLSPIVALPPPKPGEQARPEPESAPFFWPLRAPASVVNHALRGIAEVLPVLLATLLFLIGLAAVAGVLGARRPMMSNKLGAAGVAGIALAILISWPVTGVEIFTGSAAGPGSWLAALGFIAAFGGVASRVVLNGVFSRYSAVHFFESIGERPLPGLAARISICEAALALIPAVPVATIAAAFIILVTQRKSELGGLSELMMRTVASPGTLWWNGTVLTLTLAFLSFSGIWLLLEIRRVLIPPAGRRAEA